MHDKTKLSDFISMHKYLIVSVVNYGYDSTASSELEKSIRAEFQCALKTSRKTLFAPFIKLWAESTKPGFFVVGARHLSNNSIAQDIPVILNPEEIVNKDLRAKRVLEFVGLK